MRLYSAFIPDEEYNATTGNMRVCLKHALAHRIQGHEQQPGGVSFFHCVLITSRGHGACATLLRISAMLAIDTA